VSEALSNLGSENRTFAPTEAFASQANAKQEIYERADKDYLAFWEEQASALYWHKKWDRVLAEPFCKMVYWGKAQRFV
jgi:acetyl-CoA synthetase